MWNYKNKQIKGLKDIPKDHKDSYGFIYEIVGENGKRYIGMKSIWQKNNRIIGKRELEKIDDKRKIRKRRVKSGKKKGDWVYYEERKKETDWLEYTGSSDTLNEDINKGLKYDKYILEFIDKKGKMLYRETKAIICSGALESDNYYNRHVLSKFFTNNI